MPAQDNRLSLVECVDGARNSTSSRIVHLLSQQRCVRDGKAAVIEANHAGQSVGSCRSGPRLAVGRIGIFGGFLRELQQQPSVIDCREQLVHDGDFSVTVNEVIHQRANWCSAATNIDE